MNKLDNSNNQSNSPFERRIPLREAMGYVINAFLIIILALALYAKIDSSFDVNWRDVGFELIFIYMISSIIYINSLSLGKLNGQKKEEYKQAYKECNDATDKLSANKYIVNLDKFCLERQESDLEARKRVVLSSVYIPYDDYKSKYAGKSIKELKAMKRDEIKDDDKKKTEDGEKAPLFNRVQLRALTKVMYMRPHKLSPQSLTKPLNAKTKEFIEDCGKIERKIIAKKLIMSFATVVIVVNFSIEIVNAFSYKTVVESIVRLIPILWSWVSGQFAGYNISVNNKVAYYNDKARYCLQADNWLNEQNGVNK